MDNSVSAQVPFSRYWMFQFNPAVYDWFSRIKLNPPYEQWLVTSNASLVCVGDKVAVWASGKDGGVCALAETISYPLKNPLNAEQAKYYSSEDAADRFRKKPSVNIRYMKTFPDKPVAKAACEVDPVLCSLEILKTFNEATNFKLTKAQWGRILEMVQ